MRTICSGHSPRLGHKVDVMISNIPTVLVQLIDRLFCGINQKQTIVLQLTDNSLLAIPLLTLKSTYLMQL